ncbi:MAG: nitroreductase family protein [Treponema sp.]|jgi:nitroreductase|nr:nitroreductase family protein [Treponema sp.]
MTTTVTEILKKRYSSRAYSAEPVTQYELSVILEAGLSAPSGMGKQSAVLVAVTKKTMRDKLSELNAKVMGTTSDPFYGAPAVIVVLADSSVSTYVEDGSLALGTMLITATALGLGSCWIHRAREIFDSPEGEKLKKDWNIPDTYRGIGFCILGHKTDSEKHAERKTGRIIKID